ncbi:hypothetical protein Q3G72_021734 [Acer saccharum]|nr:hypothetical protein Q3G72_021734 [Acer saccharum]
MIRRKLSDVNYFGAAVDTITASRSIRDPESIISSDNAYKLGFFSPENKAEGTASLSFEFAIDSTTYFVLDTEGRLLQNNRVDGKEEWQIRQTYPENVCDVYGKCGEFGICGPRSEPICSCLRGFEPKNIEEWSRGNWTRGCVRRTPLQCESINKTGDAGKEDGFLKFGMLKLPDFAERTTALEDRCRELCLSNCSCIAYAYDAGIGCMSWRDNLTDVQQFYSKGTDFYIRVAHSELDKKDMNMKVVIIVPVVVGAVVIAISAFFLWRWMAKRKALKEKSSLLQREEGTRNISGENKSKDKLQDLPLFDFEKLAAATKDFHLRNKLGEGGFGPVYKGILEDGQEIAVKRLSKASGQGVEEFMNEVMVISKLQHRNLVRLLGCCIDGEEKMLIYEFMPNKSLDAFLFDPEKRKLLDWSNRFNIIEGISREDNKNGTASLSFEFAIDPMIHFVLDSEGRLLQNNRVDGKEEWQIRLSYPENVCDVYGKCGEFGICGPRSEPICSCLRGFEPKNIEEWSRGNWTSGCVRRTPLQCESINKTGDAGKEDGFLKFGMLKLPDFAERTTALEDRCMELCLSNCSCIAYAYDAGIGCMSWRDNLTDVQQFYSKGTDFYIRVAHSELDKKDRKVVIIVPVVVGAVVIAISAFFLWRWMAKRKGNLLNDLMVFTISIDQILYYVLVNQQ